jgi:hypothetical protein
MMNTQDVLQQLKDRGVRTVDMARVLGLRETRVSEIRFGKRRLLFDEGVALIRGFGLVIEEEPTAECLGVIAEQVAATMNSSGKDAATKVLAASLEYLKSRPTPATLQAFLQGLAAARAAR